MTTVLAQSRRLERTLYYAKPGQADAVLATRREASEVRASLGLAYGRIAVRAALDGDAGAQGPDVTWDCVFVDAASWQADMDARAASPAFAAVRRQMAALVDRFERQVFDIAEDVVDADPAGLDVTDWPVVPEQVQFDGPRGPLTGFFYRPPGAGPFPCMVINHGSALTADNNEVAKSAVALTLTRWGIAVLCPNRWGYGRTPGAHWREEVTGAYGTSDYDEQLLARLDAESDDVAAARAYAASRPEVIAGRIGVMGSSFGGVVSLFAGVKEPRFACVVDFAGAAMNWERAPRLREHMLDAASRLTRPVFFIQAANDFSIGPTKELPAVAEKGGVAVQARIYPALGFTHDEGHRFERDGIAVWAPDVRRFLSRYL